MYATKEKSSMLNNKSLSQHKQLLKHIPWAI